MKTFSPKVQAMIFILAGVVLISCNNKSRTDETKEEVSTISGDSTQAEGASVQIKVRNKHPYGSYLSDGSGRSLYLFKKDSKLHQGDIQSTCYDECAEAWPPLLAGNAKIKAGAKVDTTLLETIERDDESLQVTYNGYPLYYSVDDKKPGDVMGQDKKEYGAEWYLVKPNGKEVADIEEK